MRLTTIALIVFSINISASVYSQKTKLSLEVKNKSIKEALFQIEKQSEYRFIYGSEKLNLDKQVSIREKDQTIDVVLNRLFEKERVKYEITENNLILINPEEKEKSSQRAVSQDKKRISGTVKDSKGEPIIGANVLIKGTATGNTTDINGHYELYVPEKAILQISFIGYLSKEVTLSSKSVYDIVLNEDMQMLEEIVIIGYGTQKKANLTGAVAQVSGEVMKDRQVSNVGQALQGTIGNLLVTTTGDPGGVGTPATFNVRGITSINGGSPLFVVDGIPNNNIDNVNPSDIESVTVLKDAASSAIYGARAAYGVILITTKKGSAQKTTVSYSGMVAMSQPTRLPKQANSLQFAETYNAAAQNSGLTNPFSDEYIQRIKQYMADPGSIPVTTTDPTNPIIYGYENANANTDWFHEYLKSNTFSHKHDINVSGGNKAITYFMSLGYYDQNGILRHGNENYKRVNATSNLHAEPLDWLRFDLRMRYSRSNTDNPYPYSNNNGNWFHFIGTRQPIWPAVNPDGNYSLISNINTFYNGARDKIAANDLWITGAVEIEPIKDWKINADYTFNSANSNRLSQENPIYAYQTDGAKYPYYTSSSIAENAIMDTYSSFNVYTSYTKQLEKHYFKLLLGQQVELAQYYTLAGSRRDLISESIPSMGVATGTQTSSDSRSEWATVGTFMRLNYNFDEKYLIEFNARYDGTSRFPKNNRFGFFPSVSVGYNIAKEDFFTVPEEIMNNLKIRASYGSLGNQSVSNYIYFATVPINTQLGYLLNNIRPNYLGAPGLVSKDLTWETSNTLDIGLDASLFNNKLELSFDWYSRKTLDMLGPANALPATLGAGVPLTNNADLRTNGFELNIGWKDYINKDFQYNISFVLSDYVSKVTKYNNPTGLLSTYYEGQTIGEYWGYETKGLIQTEEQLKQLSDQSLFYGNWNIGDVEYKDQNNDGVINYGKNTKDDHGDLKVIGNNTPRFQFGLTAGFNWRNFDVSLFFQGIAKRDLWLGGTMFYGLTGGYGSQVWESSLDYWTPENTNAYFPRPYHTGEVEKNRQVTDQYMQNAAYIRLKNMQIGYTIPKEILDKCKISRLRIFLTGENMFTISGIHENFDPEVATGNWGSGKMYPLMRTFSCGLNLEF